MRTDVGDAHDAGALVDATLEWGGRLDVLVNNAGIIHTADFLDIAEADFDACCGSTSRACSWSGRRRRGQMVAQAGRHPPGAIVNMSSINARLAIPNQVPYCVSKGGLDQLTKVMALSLAPYGIRVNAIGPGSIMTDMLKRSRGRRGGAEPSALGTPLGRIGEPEEIAASPRSSPRGGELYDRRRPSMRMAGGSR